MPRKEATASMTEIIGIIKEALTDTLKTVPVLFLAYLIMELLEHKAGEKTNRFLARVGRFGPVIGSAFGIIPQCGFSSAAAGFFAAGIITPGTLIAVFIATSDEMLPILISERAGVGFIFSVIGIKFVSAALFGFLIDLAFSKKQPTDDIHHLCEQEHCSCEHNLLLSVIKHTLKISALIFLVSAVLGAVIDLGGDKILSRLLLKTPVVGELIAGLVGLIPGCSVSVLLTKLYLGGIVSPGAMIAGLSSNAGVALPILLRLNKNTSQNLKIVAGLYFCAVLTGLVANLII